MNALRTLLLCLLVVWSLGPARATEGEGTTDTGDLLRFCKEEKGSPRRLVCMGYISGIGDTMQLLGLVEGFPPETKDLAMCGTARYSAMVQAFVNWAEKHPERWEEPRRLGVMAALKELWPCK